VVLEKWELQDTCSTKKGGTAMLVKSCQMKFEEFWLCRAQLVVLVSQKKCCNSPALLDDALNNRSCGTAVHCCRISAANIHAYSSAELAGCIAELHDVALSQCCNKAAVFRALNVV
jgi:hypothetical protein